MTPNPYEVWSIRIRLRECYDRRFCVILELPGADGRLRVVLASAQFDLFNPALDLRLDPTMEGFQETGLERGCYLIGSRIFEAETHELQKRVGRLGGEVLTRFNDWLG